MVPDLSVFDRGAGTPRSSRGLDQRGCQTLGTPPRAEENPGTRKLVLEATWC